MKHFLFCLFFAGLSSSLFAQRTDLGSVSFAYGTTVVYRTTSLQYHAPDLLASAPAHALYGGIGVGIWGTSLYERNRGFQLHGQLGYLLGAGRHHLELSAGVTSHFDKALGNRGTTYIGLLPRTFAGYRFQPPDGRFFLKLGVGWYEVLQMGIGYRL